MYGYGTPVWSNLVKLGLRSTNIPYLNLFFYSLFIFLYTFKSFLIILQTMIVPKLDFYYKLKENDNKYITIFGIIVQTKIKISINFDNEKN